MGAEESDFFHYNFNSILVLVAFHLSFSVTDERFVEMTKQATYYYAS